MENKDVFQNDTIKEQENNDLENNDLENNNLENNDQDNQETDKQELESFGGNPEEVQAPELGPIESIVELETEYNYRSQKFCQLYNMRIKRKSRLINAVMIAILVVLGVVFYINSKQLLMLIFPLLLCISPVYNIVCEEKRIDKFLVKYFASHPKFTLKYMINEEVIRFSQYVDGEEKVGEIPWAYVSEVHAVPEYYFLYLNGGNMFILDRNEEVMIKGEKKDLDDLILKVTEFKPLRVYDKPYCKNFVEVTYFVPQETSKNQDDLESNKADNSEE